MKEKTKENVQHSRHRDTGRIAGQGMQKDTAATLLFKTNNENFAELFNRALPCEPPLSAEELQDEDIKETARIRITRGDGSVSLVQYRDVVKSVKSGRSFAVFGIEHQSEIDYAMPFRVLELDFVNYARQMQVIQEKHNAEWGSGRGQRHIPEGLTSGEYLGRFLKTDRLSRCVTLVLYWGKEPWDGPVKLSDLFADDTETAYALQLEIRLLDVCRMADEEICSYTGELRTVFGFRKYADDKEALGNFINENREYFTNVSETAVNALAELTHSSELMKIRTQEYTTTEGGIDVCKGIQGMIRDGKLEGIREGKAEARKEIAISLSAMGMSDGKIAEATGVSTAIVQEWLSGKA